ncbi:hypothetical protein EZV62_024692 [Acer yangbiense]|uniref:CCHC-type domain-containing protein n=1 Tax=Acer yangbiense TaxID=1000413 RepID=A0A5C7GWD8_9ROSI|nr:hypothetical protein EZV62_024692 [Acer yangbiense]
MHQLPYPNSTLVTTKPLELVHTDLWGPAPMLSTEGYRYYISFVDSFSRFVWVFPLRLKSEAFNVFVQFHKMVELQFNTKLQCLQTDMGKEFLPILTYFKSLGVNYRATSSSSYSLPTFVLHTVSPVCTNQAPIAASSRNVHQVASVQNTGSPEASHSSQASPEWRIASPTTENYTQQPTQSEAQPPNIHQSDQSRHPMVTRSNAGIFKPKTYSAICSSPFGLVAESEPRNIKTLFHKSDSAKEFLKVVEEHFKTVDKSLAGTLMAQPTTMKYNGVHGMQNYILEMTNLAAKLKTLGMTVSESFLVQFILNSLPAQYGPFQIHYNTIKDKWNVNELTNMVVQEEARLKQQGMQTVYLTTQGSGSGHKGRKLVKGKKRVFSKNEPAHASQVQKKDFGMKCHFCKKEGHFKKDCQKRKEWFEKKGMNIYVIFESNLIEVPSNTWWIDSGATVHVSNTMQGFLTTRTILSNEQYIMMGNLAKVPVKAVGTFRLVLDSGFNLDLFHTYMYHLFPETLFH